jgi:hypothetical protein
MDPTNTLSPTGIGVATAPARRRDWRFVDTGATRDPRLDLMRGLVFVLLFAVHFDYFSVFTFFAWERIGVVSSAETFIALAGIVTGLVFGRKLDAEGLQACLPGLFSRAVDLYKINLLVILSIGLSRYVPGIDSTALTTFHDPYTGTTYPLYPPLDAGLVKLVIDAVLLRCGPHQFQVMGLYVTLFLLSPAILYMIGKRKTWLLSAISVTLYLINFFMPETTPGTAQIRLSGAQFEFAFPLLAWQVLFVHAVIAGYHKTQIVDWFSQAAHRGWLWTCVALAAAFMVFSLNHPIDLFPDWARLEFIPPDTFNWIFHTWFQKYKLGPGRLLNEVVLFVAVYALFTRCWQPLNRAIGWLFIPLGAASLYVFTIHILMIRLVVNTPLPGLHNFWVNSAIHLGALLLAWYAVKKQFLFRWLPH